MTGKMVPSLFGVKMTVNIPDGLPELMMNVIREVLRDPPGDGEIEILSFVADYLERLLEERRKRSGDLMDMVTYLTKTDEGKYLDGLKQTKRCTDEQLDKLATTIQRKWKKYKGYDHGDIAAKDIGTDDNGMVTGGIFKTLKDEAISFEKADTAAVVIQKSWKKFRPFTSTKRFGTEDMEELDFESDSDDMERVNVVKKDQRDYVPPIPDFINDSFDIASVTDGFDQLMENIEGEEA